MSIRDFAATMMLDHGYEPTEKVKLNNETNFTMYDAQEMMEIKRSFPPNKNSTFKMRFHREHETRKLVVQYIDKTDPSYTVFFVKGNECLSQENLQHNEEKTTTSMVESLKQRLLGRFRQWFGICMY